MALDCLDSAVRIAGPPEAPDEAPERPPDEAPERPPERPAAEPPPDRADEQSGRFSLRLDVAVPMVIRAGGVLVQLAMLAWLNGSDPASLLDRLTKWDGLFYAEIAQSGYPAHVTVAADGTLAEGTEFAFHPLFPSFAAGLHVLGIPARTAVVLVACVAGLAAAVVVHLLTRHVLGTRRAGYIAVALLGVLPASVALQMGYAESLYIALAAGTVLAALRQRWWLAGGLAFAAGLTRPTAIALVVVVPLAVWHARRQARGTGGTYPRWPVVIGASVVAAAGVPAYWVWLWIRTGDPATWFTVEDHGWASHVDFGRQTWDFVYANLSSPDTFLGPVVCAVLLGYVLACVLLVLGRWPAPLTGVVLLSAALVLLSTNYWHSKPRLLLGAFLLVVPAAGALARFRTRTTVILLAVATLASAWFGAYLLDVWPYAI
jgi:Mannosyltransferase (PIG-V)